MAVQVAMSGARKAAILLLTLGEDPLSEVCKHLREEEIEVIIKELTTLGTVSAEIGERILDEFNALASKAVTGPMPLRPSPEALSDLPRELRSSRRPYLLERV